MKSDLLVPAIRRRMDTGIRLAGAALLLAAAAFGCRSAGWGRGGPSPRTLAESHFQRAVRLTQSGKRERAREALQTALDTDPDHLASRLFLAGLLRGAGEATTALAAYDQAVATAARRGDAADQVMALGNRADCLLEQGRYGEAEADLDRALAVKPEEVALQFKRGECRMAQRNFSGALDDFTLAARLAPHRPDVWMRRGDCLAALSRFQDAAADYTVALERAPRDAGLAARRAAAWEAAGDLNAALADYARALDLDPDDFRRWYDRGMIYLMLGQPTAAAADFDQALKRDSRRPEIRMGRGLAYEMAGDDGRALREYEQALALDPDFAPAARERERVLTRAGSVPVQPLRPGRFEVDAPAPAE